MARSKPEIVVIGAGVDRAGHRMAAGPARRRRDGVRQGGGRAGREPCGGRHAGGLRRGRARRRGPHRARPVEPIAVAGLRRRTGTGERSCRRSAARGHAGAGADRRRSRAASPPTRIPAEVSVCRSNGSRPPRCAGASRIWRPPSRAPSGARKTIRSTIASWRRPCASRPSAPAPASASTRRSSASSPRTDGERSCACRRHRDSGRRRRAGGGRLVARHCRACRPRCGRRCVRSRDR